MSSRRAALGAAWGTLASIGTGRPGWAASERWQRSATRVLPSAYTDLELTEFTLPEGPAPRGGALALDGSRLIVASADGRFIGLDPRSGEITRDPLPRLDLQRDAMPRSAFIRLQEVLPRVHDLLLTDSAAYVSFDRFDPAEDRVRCHLARSTPRGQAWQTLWRTPPLDVPMYTLGSGGRLALAPDAQQLFFTVGDYSLDRRNGLPSDLAAQNPAQPWGKVMVMNTKSGAVRMHSLGHRSAQGLAWLADGRLLATEHGPQGGDEINLVLPGRNYGWPWRSHGTHYGSFDTYAQRLGPPPPGPFEEPLHAWVPSVAPTQLIQLQRGFHPRWDGGLAIGSLKAMTLFLLRLQGERVAFVEPVPLGHRIRCLKQLPTPLGLLLLADGGTLLTLRAVPSKPSTPSR